MREVRGVRGVQAMRDHLDAHSWPRLNCLLMVAVSTGAAFLASVLLLVSNLDSMALRYGIAALAGYLTFLTLVRAWVRWKSRQVKEPDFDVIDAVTNGLDLPLPRSSGGSIEPPAFAGGRSGGGGASMAFGSPAPPPPAAPAARSSSGISLDLDADDVVWILVVLLAAFAGFAAIGYVIYLAPTLLAEAMVDVMIAGGIYRRLRRHDSDHWTGHVLKRTAIPAAIVIVSAVAAGDALQRIAPEARSIGGVWVSLTK